MASFPKVDSVYQDSIASASKDIKALIDKEHCVPMFIRLAFNDAMTYDASTNTSGCNGSIRNKKELAHPGNKGLDIAVELLKPIKTKYASVTWADLIQLAGMKSIEAAGGPHIPFTPGRKDSWSFPPPGRLPDPLGAQEPAAHLKLVAERLGLPLRQFVALMGVHTVARWWRDVQPPYMEQFYSNPPHRFDNTYFRDMTWGKLPKDGWLLGDVEIRNVIEAFAEDDAIFQADYAVAHEALSLLGTKMAPAREAAAAAQAEAVGQRLELSYGAQAAVGAATVILGIVVVGGWYWRRRRRLQQFA